MKVTHSRVRRKRMGHINLAAPVLHIWFFKSMPNRLGTILGMKSSDLEKIIYFQDYVVTDAGRHRLKAGQLLSEEEYRDAMTKYGNSFKASMGAEAIKTLLEALDLDVAGRPSAQGDHQDQQQAEDRGPDQAAQDHQRDQEQQQQGRVDGPGGDPGDPAGPAAAGAAGERTTSPRAI